MKKLFFSFCLFLMTVTVFAQDYYKEIPNGEFELSEKCTKTKEQKLLLIEEWASINFKPGQYTLQKNDLDGRVTINWETTGETFSKYTRCNVASIYIIDLTEEGYSVKVRKPQCILKPTGFPHQYVMPFRSSVNKAIKQFIDETSEKYYRKSLTWDDDQHIFDIETALYEESIRLPRNQDGTPKASKRYFIMVEKHNICETVRGSVMKANISLLEGLYKTMNQ